MGAYRCIRCPRETGAVADAAPVAVVVAAAALAFIAAAPAVAAVAAAAGVYVQVLHLQRALRARELETEDLRQQVIQLEARMHANDKARFCCCCFCCCCCCCCCWCWWSNCCSSSYCCTVSSLLPLFFCLSRVSPFRSPHCRCCCCCCCCSRRRWRCLEGVWRICGSNCSSRWKGQRPCNKIPCY